MLFSVITVTYNSAKHVATAVESVLAQDHTILEYIIVDGGSTDGTLDVIRDFAAHDPRIRWISEPDHGIADAFNKGIRMAKGDIIGILNSDDRYAPDALRLVADAATSHPECDVFHGNMLRYQGDKPLFMLKPSDVSRNIWHEMPLNHPTTFVTRHAYQKAGFFDTELRIAMDYDMMLRLYTAGFRFLHIDEVLAHMCYGGVSDERVLAGLNEVYQVSVRQGYPRWKAACWMAHKSVMRWCKLLLRKLGLYSLMRLHPKFRRIPTRGMQ